MNRIYIENITKEEIEEKIRKKLKPIKHKRIISHSILAKNIFSERGSLFSTVEKKINKEKEKAALKLNCDSDKIKVRYSHNWDYRGPDIELYTTEPENLEKFEKRIKKEVNERWKKILLERRKIREAKKREEEKRREDAVKAIEYLGEDVYEIFKQLNK